MDDFERVTTSVKKVTAERVAKYKENWNYELSFSMSELPQFH